jgi:hypothetical protein
LLGKLNLVWNYLLSSVEKGRHILLITSEQVDTSLYFLFIYTIPFFNTVKFWVQRKRRQNFTQKHSMHCKIIHFFICNSIAKPAVTGTHKYISPVQNTKNSWFNDLWYRGTKSCQSDSDISVKNILFCLVKVRIDWIFQV